MYYLHYNITYTVAVPVSSILSSVITTIVTSVICWFSLKRKKLTALQKETTPPIYDAPDIDTGNVGINTLELKENYSYGETNNYY